jgi:hypothetical protein
LSRYVPRLLEAGVDDEGFKALRLEVCRVANQGARLQR